MRRKRLNKKRVFNFIVVLVALVLFTITAVKVVSDLDLGKDKVVKKELDIIKPYGYRLDDRDTTTYKKYFKELKEVLKGDSVDDEKYAKLLTKLFVTDFYTLDNKLSSTDIGSIEFIHKLQVENFRLNAEETMYKTVESDLYGERKQVLPKVSSVKVDNIESTKYKVGDNEFDGYKVECSWIYSKDLGYENKGTFILIKDDNKLNVVEKVSEDEENID